ncbi:hypothetical protein K466DRAFT_567436 [Polyporus arcularius HHB13444]|uniref:Uncharacterized protein n=1 Tax=Polyporus arcularius HHB13444 TaxID=1314778 RepID=A0A5C3P344_9APHY|nr:hypothetical protein K466DRAFT_567436 [Polyporus arcularius HHB13444]
MYKLQSSGPCGFAPLCNTDCNESTPEDPELTNGVCGSDAEACLSTAIQEIRRFTDQHLSPTTISELRLRNQAARRRVSAKMSTYFAIRQRNVQMQKQNADILKELALGHRSLKDSKRELSRHSAALSKSQRMHRKEVDDLNAAIARASQSVERRLRHVTPEGGKEKHLITYQSRRLRPRRFLMKIRCELDPACPFDELAGPHYLCLVVEVINH